MTLCSNKNSIPSTNIKIVHLDDHKFYLPTPHPQFETVILAIRRIGRATELMAFIFLKSRCQFMFSLFASVSVIKLWVAPESTIVLSQFVVNLCFYVHEASFDRLF